MSYTNHSLPYNNQDDMEFTQPHYTDFNHYPSDRLADSAAEGRTVLYPSQLHPHPLFTRQENAGPSIQNRSLEPHILNPHHSVYHSPSPFTPPQQQHTPQNWPPYDSYPQNYSYAPYPSPSPFPAPRLSPPPIHHTPIHFKSTPNISSTSPQIQRMTLAGSLDPSTGIFYRTPEHPRLRTAQACEKCRTRKAKCSGEHPTCKRCSTRGLICEYAKEGRVRGPNKTKSKSANSGNDSSSNTSANIRNDHARVGPRGRTSSANSSVGSSDHHQLHQEQQMHPQKNMTVIQAHSQGRSTPSSSSPQKRFPHGIHTQTDHLMTLGLPYSVSPLQSPSISEELMYPPYLPHSAPPLVISPSTSRMGMKMELDVDPVLHGSRSGLGGSVSIPIEPVWIDHLGQINAYPHLNSNSEHPHQGTGEGSQNGFLDGNKPRSTQNGVVERNLFMKNGQDHVDSQQDHFHGQSQSHNETQHYSALDLQMC